MKEILEKTSSDSCGCGHDHHDVHDHAEHAHEEHHHRHHHDDEHCGCGCEDHEDDETENEEITCYIMKVITSTEEDGEEVEEFVPVDDALEAKLIEVATTKLSADDPDEEE